jgi:hypothetical protein
MPSALRALLAIPAIVASSLICGAQPRILNLDPLMPLMNASMRVQRVACVGDTCIVVYGMTRAVSRRAVVATLHWRRIVGGVEDSLSGALPAEARPTASVAVAAIAGGVRVVWDDERSDAAGIYAMDIATDGDVVTPPRRILAARLDSMRLFGSNDDQLLLGRASAGEMIAVRLSGPPILGAMIDIVAAGAPSVAWRAHAIGDLVAIPDGDSLRFRDVETYELFGCAAAERFRRPFRLESDSSLWVCGDSTLEFFTRFDAPIAARSYPRPPMTVQMPGALWIVRMPDSAIAIASAYEYRSATYSRDLGIATCRLLKDGTFTPSAIDTSVVIEGWPPISFSLKWFSVQSLGVASRGIEFQFEMEYRVSHGAPVEREAVNRSFVVTRDGRLRFFPGHVTWSPNDEPGSGLPIGVRREALPGVESVRLVRVEPPRDVYVRDSVVHVSIGTPQYQPSVVEGDSGFVVAWLDVPPGELQRGLVARWDGRADTVTGVAWTQEWWEERIGSIRRFSIGMNAHPGAAVLTTVYSEATQGEKPSHGSQRTETWAASLATPSGTWAKSEVGSITIRSYEPSPPGFTPAGGVYFHSTSYDPRRREIALLAAVDTSRFIAMAIDHLGRQTWELTFPMISGRTIVPVDSARILIVDGDSIWRANSAGTAKLPARLVEPLINVGWNIVGGRLARLLDDSFIQLAVDSSGSVRIHHYGIDGSHRRTTSFTGPAGATWYMTAQRPSDSSIAIAWSVGRQLHITLLDRMLVVRTADSVVAAAPVAVGYPACAFIDDSLVIAYESHDSSGSDIGIVRLVLPSLPATAPSEPSGSDGRTSLAVLRSTPASDGFFVESARALPDGFRIDVADASGAIVASQARVGRIGTGEILLSRRTLPPGVYLVRVASSGRVEVLRGVVLR